MSYKDRFSFEELKNDLKSPRNRIRRAMLPIFSRLEYKGKRYLNIPILGSIDLFAGFEEQLQTWSDEELVQTIEEVKKALEWLDHDD